MAKTKVSTGKITPQDLENKLRAFQGGVQGKVASKKNTLLAVGGTGVTLLLIIFFLLGKRSGKKKTTLVEIRRI
jgi:cellobiose-specific phosphotransferase system component IIC